MLITTNIVKSMEFHKHTEKLNEMNKLSGQPKRQTPCVCTYS